MQFSQNQSLINETHPFFHGEKVAFGALVQLVLENAPRVEFQEVLYFSKSIGLPTCLSDLGVKHLDAEKLMLVSQIACAEGDTMGNMPFVVKPSDVYSAILVADQMGAI